MWMGNLKVIGAALALALAALLLGSCGSGGSDSTTVKRPPLSAATADHLAKLSDRVATDLDAGSTCDAAYAADQLSSAVEDSDLPASLRPSVEEAATRLVDQVNCPPPPPAPEPKKKKEKPKDEEGDHGDHGEQGPQPPGHSKHGGFVPPGHAKLKGGTE